jgi:hypothetical protein
MRGRKAKRRKGLNGADVNEPNLKFLLGAKFAGVTDDGGLPHISEEVIVQADVIVLDVYDFDTDQREMAELAQDTVAKTRWKERVDSFGNVKAGYSDVVDWQKTSWTPAAMRKRGYRDIHKTTVVLVGDRVVLVFVVSDEKLQHLDRVRDYMHEDVGSKKRFVRHGLSTVGRGVQKPSSGLMLMGGHHYAQTSAGIRKERRIYGAGAANDERLSRMLNDYVTKEALALEMSDVPGIGHARREAIRRSDPFGVHATVTDDGSCASYASSFTNSYVVGPHTDGQSKMSGVTESIFVSATGVKLPKGHMWGFAAAKVICRMDSNRSCRIYVPADVYHGTLPTHSTEATTEHGGVASALVLKDDMIKQGLFEYE